ncbi:type IV pilus biogenesis/stability protein PilW [Alteromonas halophila]|uniref:LysM domain-containing protein n=1 Tax=Alteromonas halophila TaxID=516698 RepID=A0A918MZR7_9ALTE|nr:type IV pilus biogenesis/stability protein PilW [Alteromonas halophila]GGW86479.1 hypothetical protein GCM10007391_20200 [Alteromonas halophila]
MRITTPALVILLSGCVSNPQPGTFKDDFDRQDAAKTRISLGLTYLKNGNYPQAKSNLDKALEFAPRSADVHYSLAYYYQRVGENKRANDAYTTAIDLAPRNADIANSYGAFLCQTGDYDAALDYFQKAINNQRYANSAETYENMALCSQSEGDYKQAVNYLEEALNHQPGRAKSLFLLAELYVENKQYDKAETALNRFERVGQVTPDYLWLAIKVAQGQGNYKTAEEYGDMLIAVYPSHRLVSQYRQLAKNWPQVAVTRKAKAADPAPASAKVSASDDTSGKNVARETAQPNKSSTASTQATSEQTSASGAQAEISLPATDSDQQPRFHIVKAKENLYRISLKYNIKLSTLQSWNELDDSGAIFAGMKLWLIPPNEQEK